MDCYLCERELTSPTRVTYQVPLSRGGSYKTPGNKRKVHESCARIKGGRLDTELELPLTHDLPEDDGEGDAQDLWCITRCMHCDQTYGGMISEGNKWFKTHHCEVVDATNG